MHVKYMHGLSLLCSLLLTLIPLQADAKSRPSAKPVHKPVSRSMQEHIAPPGEKLIIVDPRIHRWGAYSADGTLLRTGTATAGADWCKDIRRGCRTEVGYFRIYTLGSAGCKSHRYPRPRGGAPMPYCMFFNGGQGLHGSNAVAEANLSHGCVRMHVHDAKWVRFDFAEAPNAKNEYRGTKVIVRPY